MNYLEFNGKLEEFAQIAQPRIAENRINYDAAALEIMALIVPHVSEHVIEAAFLAYLNNKGIETPEYTPYAPPTLTILKQCLQN